MLRILRRIAIFIGLPALFVTIGALLAGGYLIGTSKSLSGDGNWFETPQGMDEAGFREIGGVNQFVRIRSRDRNNPVMLDLHGGPGAAQSGYTHRMLRPLTEYFTLVEWDQRGAGRSEGGVPHEATYERMVDDAIELIELLNGELGSEKVVLVGHSWGSMLGLGVIKKRPDLVHAYVGVGQGLAWRANFDETRRLVMARADAIGDQRTLGEMKALGDEWPPQDDVDGLMERIMAIQAPIFELGKSIHASHNGHYMKTNLVLDAVTSPDITIRDALGSLSFSETTKSLWMDLYHRDFRDQLGYEFEVPIVIFQGEHDWQTSTTLVKPWFEEISAPRKIYVPFEHSAHFIMNEEPGKYTVEMVTQVLPLTQR